MRADPTPKAHTVGQLEASSPGLQNLGCLEAMDLVHHLRTKGFPEIAVQGIRTSEAWCQVRHPTIPTVTGWVDADFVAED
jgi:hypothetical protein